MGPVFCPVLGSGRASLKLHPCLSSNSSCPAPLAVKVARFKKSDYIPRGMLRAEVLLLVEVRVARLGPHINSLGERNWIP